MDKLDFESSFFNSSMTYFTEFREFEYPTSIELSKIPAIVKIAEITIFFENWRDLEQ